MKKLLIYLVVILFSVTSYAQNSSSIQELYSKALTEYDNGRFDDCEATALKLVPEARGLLRTSGYRLLALCRLENGDREGAVEYVTQLLKYNPYYSPGLGEPARFVDIVNDCKNREAGITTASRQEETIDEAPVPVTLITEDMIRNSGALTLQEVLALYVPGMTLAEGMETNIAMHGIYSLSQDKILFMVDGHRLNSSTTNAEAPDFRSSLDKIQQIEVLRGPASSLYGNVALTAVVNIITRKGAQLNGGRISGVIGTQNTYGGSFVVGGGNNVIDIMGWGSIYHSKGFAHSVDNGLGQTNTLYVQGYRGRPSYDVGLKGRWQDFTLSLNMQRSKRVPYINVIQLPNNISIREDDIYLTDISSNINTNTYRNFNYDSYSSIRGSEPGISRSNYRINLDYSHSFGNIDLQASGYLSLENTSLYNILGDSVDTYVGSAMMILMAMVPDDDAATESFKRLMFYTSDRPFSKGVFQRLDWSNVLYGFQAQALAKYNLLGHGNIVAGAQYENFSLTSGAFEMGGDFNGSMSVSSTAVFHAGSETSLSAYVQLKHFFTPRLIFNAGVRYDHKRRYDAQTLDRFSPRFSLIYKLNDNLSIRGNYNYSFVDAPYLYRACIIPYFAGGRDMKPEVMNGFNIGALYHNTSKHLLVEIDGFYNILNDLAVVNTAMRKKDGGDSDYIFINAGKVRSIGVEASAQYTQPRFFTNVNLTYQRIMTSQAYIVSDGQTFSTPAFHANGTVAYMPCSGKGNGFFNGGRLWLRSTLQFQTSTKYRTLDILASFMTGDPMGQMNHVSPQCIMGVGLSYDWKFLDVDLTVRNLFNNEYKIGSMLIDGIPRAGRSFLAKLTFKF